MTLCVKGLWFTPNAYPFARDRVATNICEGRKTINLYGRICTLYQFGRDVLRFFGIFGEMVLDTEPDFTSCPAVVRRL